MRGNEEPEEEEKPEVEISESGTPILRHRAAEGADFVLGGPTSFAEAIEAHVERHIGPVEGVFHEILSPLVHVDVLVVRPRPERPFTTLVTSGMSGLPMSVPPEVQAQLETDGRFAEMLVCLPPEWKLDDEAFQDEANYWPIRMLKTLARLPHEYKTWLWEGHTIPNGDPPEPFAPNTRLCCAMLAPPLSLDPEAHTLRAEDESGAECEVSLFAMQTLHADEVAYKLKHGAAPLYELLDEHGVGDLLDITRPSIVPARRPWWRRR